MHITLYLKNFLCDVPICCLKPFCDSTILEGDPSAQIDRNRLLGESNAGDTILIPKLSHLANSVRSLSNILRTLHEKRVHLHSLHEDIESTDAGAEYFFQLVDVFANVEKSVIAEQLKHSRSRMKSKMNGRRPKLSPQNRKLFLKLIEGGQTPSNAASKFGISRSSAYEYIRRFRGQKKR